MDGRRRGGRGKSQEGKRGAAKKAGGKGREGKKSSAGSWEGEVSLGQGRGTITSNT